MSVSKKEMLAYLHGRATYAEGMRLTSEGKAHLADVTMVSRMARERKKLDERRLAEMRDREIEILSALINLVR